MENNKASLVETVVATDLRMLNNKLEAITEEEGLVQELVKLSVEYHIRKRNEDYYERLVEEFNELINATSQAKDLVTGLHLLHEIADCNFFRVAVILTDQLESHRTNIVLMMHTCVLLFDKYLAELSTITPKNHVDVGILQFLDLLKKVKYLQGDDFYSSIQTIQVLSLHKLDCNPIIRAYIKEAISE